VSWRLKRAARPALFSPIGSKRSVRERKAFDKARRRALARLRKGLDLVLIVNPLRAA
jgi:hypothetical protein